LQEAAKAQVLVLGGTGAVGREVVRALTRAGARTTFTRFRSRDVAEALAAETEARAIEADLREPARIEEVFRVLDAAGALPDRLIHCAAALNASSLLELDVAAWDEMVAVNCRSAFVAIQCFARRLIAAKREGHVVLVGALDRAQSLPIPAGFAATQGALSAMTMALAKELGPHGIRVNMVALGILDDGLSRELDAKVRADYLRFSALRRLGSPREVAESISWLALENRYINGKVVSANGGI